MEAERRDQKTKIIGREGGVIITRTPYRISFFGGGTDYPAWYLEHGGAVLSTTIDKYCYISCRYLPPFFEHKHRIVWSRIENVKDFLDIKHPAVRAILEQENIKEGLEIHHDGDLPARSGLGSSSAFTVGLLKAIHTLKNKYVRWNELADQAIHIEQNIIKENVGSQDQVAAVYGGFNHFEFYRDNTIKITSVNLYPRLRQLENHLMLVFTGLQRNAPEIAKDQIANIENRKQELTFMHEMVEDAIAILCNEAAPIMGFGELLHESWLLKRTLASGISNDDIDVFYNALRKAGAIGGKLCGAGGGGFMLLFVEPERQAKIKDLLAAYKFIHVPFKFENEGSKVIVNV